MKKRLEDEAKLSLAIAQRQADEEEAGTIKYKAEQDAIAKSMKLATEYEAFRSSILSTRMQAVVDELMTETEAENKRYSDAAAALVAYYEDREGLEDEYRSRREALDADHEERLTQIRSEQEAKRLGIAKVYRQADLESTRAWLSMMSVAMNSSSRTMFEVGKAAAIAGAIVDAYKAATGALLRNGEYPVRWPGTWCGGCRCGSCRRHG